MTLRISPQTKLKENREVPQENEEKNKKVSIPFNLVFFIEQYVRIYSVSLPFLKGT